jgi:hypothetical protein
MHVPKTWDVNHFALLLENFRVQGREVYVLDVITCKLSLFREKNVNHNFQTEREGQPYTKLYELADLPVIRFTLLRAMKVKSHHAKAYVPLSVQYQASWKFYVHLHVGSPALYSEHSIFAVVRHSLVERNYRIIRKSLRDVRPPRQCFSNFFQVVTTFISQNVLRTTLLLSP